MDSVRFGRIVPVLRVASMETALDFYTFTLGFRVHWRKPHASGGEKCMLYVGMTGLILSTVPLDGAASLSTPPLGTLYFNTFGVAGLYAYLHERVPVVWPLGITDYGRREFAVRDPDGYTIAFSEEVIEDLPEQPYDRFLESVYTDSCITIPLLKALREHAGIGLREAMEIAHNFDVRRKARAAQDASFLPPQNPDLPTEPFSCVSHLMRQGRLAGNVPDRFTLIKALREHTGLGLRDAKGIVDSYCSEHQKDFPGGVGLLESVGRDFPEE